VTVEEAIRARILSLSAAIAICGTRVWTQQLPQSPVYPCVRVSMVDDPTMYHLRGPRGTTPARVQVDKYAQKPGDIYATLSALEAAIDGDGLGRQASGLSGFIGGIGSPPFVIKACFQQGRIGPRFDAEELNVLTMSTDYIVWYVRP